MNIRVYFGLFCAFLLLAVAVPAQPVLQLNGGGTSDELTLLEFEQSTYDLGTVKQGEVVKGSYKFKNIGKADLLIENVKPSCVCATLEFPEDVIPPGKGGEIYAEIDTSDKEGEQVKYFTVIYNGNPPVERVKLVFVVE
ncbi:MAG: DUF1573 domain-containing protein [Bacteroidota bacterium]